ncbi:MAG: tripartite tricarboxylate transporter permease [Moorella humiferrea]|nr:tripartite tricarboxylate transporter permease [Moorella humiferrea]
MTFLFTALLKMLTLKNLFFMLLGIIIGIFKASLPGIQVNTALALFLPLTYAMEPDSGLIMLVSFFAAAMYAGSIPAILFHTPGTTASAASAIEGFELTKQGKAFTALRISAWSSAIGGLFGAFMLLFISPPLSLVALKFGPPEYFLLAVFGLVTIVTVASGPLLIKGLIAGAAGLLLSTVGMDLDSGYPRFTFGLFPLQSGIPFVPAVIGLFVLAQILTMIEKGTTQIVSATAVEEKWRFFPSKEEWKQIKNAVLRALPIGLVVGILPGAGADVSAWVCYNEAKRISKHPEKFGRGAIDGLAAAEIGKNTECGGAMIPMFTLGIPGSTSSAILLGALIMYGLVPGRELFTKHGIITYTVILGFIFANILMAVIGMLISRYIVNVTALDFRILAPVIITIAVIGSYALGNNMYDVWVMLIFGLLGYFMMKYGFHPAAMALGLILGPMAEKGFRQSLDLATGSVITYFLTRPISVIMIILIIATLVAPFLMEKRSSQGRVTPTE